jgi:hypothetical protein
VSGFWTVINEVPETLRRSERVGPEPPVGDRKI